MCCEYGVELDTDRELLVVQSCRNIFDGAGKKGQSMGDAITLYYYGLGEGIVKKLYCIQDYWMLRGCIDDGKAAVVVHGWAKIETKASVKVPGISGLLFIMDNNRAPKWADWGRVEVGPTKSSNAEMSGDVFDCLKRLRVSSACGTSWFHR